MQVNHPSYIKVRQGYIKEVGSEAIVYEHKKTKARLIALVNDDDNKVFSVSFKTPPEDDFGIAHIMEHSVLCGSKKYPCKEPFVELIKSSLNTFLNAMTFSDKTMYPVASCNDDDFKNLMDVYLDAVFNPLISKEAFLQEGWHHTVNDDDSLGYKGVVFNEMKGVYSQAESYLELAKDRVFYKGTQYANESGGYPPAIPDLTYEKYLEFYKQHYHPSNSYIFLYGNIDLAHYLEHIDAGYLNKYSESKQLPIIREVTPWKKPLETVCTYPLAKEEEEDKKTYMLWSFLLDKCTNPLHLMSFSILNHILLGSSSSPLRKALMESGLCENTLNDGFDENSLQTSFSVGVKGVNSSDKDKISKVIFSTLDKLVKSKIDGGVVEAAINYHEFKIREADFGSYPRGLIYNINLMLGWLHNEQPESFLAYEDVLAELKDLVAKGDYFEGLIKQYFSDNLSYVVTICQPDKQFNDKIDAYYSERLKIEGSKLDEDGLELLRQDVKDLEAKQLKEDAPEVLAKMPTLNKGSIDKKIKYFLPNKDIVGNCPVYYTLRHTSNINYFRLAFDSRCLSLDELRYLPLFSSFYLSVGSKNFSPEGLRQQIDLITGGVSFSCLTQTSHSGELQIYSLLNMQIMQDNLLAGKSLLHEIIHCIDFSNKAKLFELLKTKKDNLLQYLKESGENVAIATVEAHFSSQGKIDDYIGGFNLLNLINSLVNNFDKLYDDLVIKFMILKEKVFNQENLSLGVTCDKKMRVTSEQFLKELIANLARRDFCAQEYNFANDSHDALAISTENIVQYVAKGVSLKGLDNLARGYFLFINQLLRTAYLWDNVRVKGGAYGCFIRCSVNQGSYIFCSYRDPNLVETLNIYDKVVDYLKNLEISLDDFDKLFIGTIGIIDKPLTAKQEGSRNLLLSLQGVTNTNLQQTRDELFAFKRQDLKLFVDLFERLTSKGKIVVHGNSNKINQNKKLFDKVVVVTDKTATEPIC